MPIYTYKCNLHGVFDYFCSYDERETEKPCTKTVFINDLGELTDQPVKLSLDRTGHICGRLSERIPHRVSMQPDTFWSGVYDPQLGRAFTRKSERREFMSNPEINKVGIFEETMSTDQFRRPSLEEQAAEKFSTPELEKERDRCMREAIKEVEEKRGTTMEKALKQEAKELRIRGAT